MLRILGRPHDVRAGAADQQRVAVGIGARDVLGRHRAAGADPVLDVELLLEGLRQMIGGDAAEPVGGAAGAERHHHLHRPVRPVLRLPARCRPATASREQQPPPGRDLECPHPSPPTCRHCAAVCYHSGKEPAPQPQARQLGRSDMEGHDNDVARRTVLMSAGVGIGAGLVSGLSPRKRKAPRRGAGRNLEPGILGATRAARSSTSGASASARRRPARSRCRSCSWCTARRTRRARPTTSACRARANIR